MCEEQAEWNGTNNWRLFQRHKTRCHNWIRVDKLPNKSYKAATTTKAVSEKPFIYILFDGNHQWVWRLRRAAARCLCLICRLSYDKWSRRGTKRGNKISVSNKAYEGKGLNRMRVLIFIHSTEAWRAQWECAGSKPNPTQTHVVFFLLSNLLILLHVCWHYKHAIEQNLN